MASGKAKSIDEMTLKELAEAMEALGVLASHAGVFRGARFSSFSFHRGRLLVHQTTGKIH